MMTRKIGIGFLAVIVLSGTGCIGLMGPVDLQRAVSSAQGVRLHREIGVNVGRVMLGIASGIVDSPVSLSDLSGVDVGVYRVVYSGAGKSVLSDLELPGYERMVRVREKGAETLILLKEDDDMIRQMVVLTRDHEELVIVRIKGRIDKFLEKAVREGAIQKEGWAGLGHVGSADPL